MWSFFIFILLCYKLFQNTRIFSLSTTPVLNVTKAVDEHAEWTKVNSVNLLDLSQSTITNHFDSNFSILEVIFKFYITLIFEIIYLYFL